MSLEFSGPATRLTPDLIATTAAAAGVPATLVQTVYTVESGGRGGFLPDTRPVILFEAHQFHSKTGGCFDAGHPNISSPVWNRTLYSRTHEGEFDRLAQAILLNRQAALGSASWGLFQVMGENYEACGFTSVEDFVVAMVAGEAGHLQAFPAFIKHEGMMPLLLNRDWAGFACRYNGVRYRDNNYDCKLRDAYAKACTMAPASPKVLRATASLNVRTGPGVGNGLAVGSPLTRDQEVTIQQRDPSGWVQIAFTHGTDAASGWVNATYLA